MFPNEVERIKMLSILGALNGIVLTAGIGLGSVAGSKALEHLKSPPGWYFPRGASADTAYPEAQPMTADRRVTRPPRKQGLQEGRGLWLGSPAVTYAEHPAYLSIAVTTSAATYFSPGCQAAAQL